MSDTIVEDRRATHAEVVAHRAAVLDLARTFGLKNLRVRADGALIASVDSPGYRAVNRFAAAASRAIGAFPVVIPDDTENADLTSTAL